MTLSRFLPGACATALLAPAMLAAAEPRFDAVTIDAAVQIGYGVEIADVDGDGKSDILLADKKQFVWYRNPGAHWTDPAQWKKHILAENLTRHDNVCIAAQDLDGDGKCEIAVGAEWNPSDTVGSGAVFYLIPPADRTQPWEPVKLHAEPTVHRMRWIPNSEGKWGLVVAPLHGRGNKNGEGAGVRVLFYVPPAGDPKGEWALQPLSETLHMTHNFDPRPAEPGILLGGKEAIVTATGSERVVIDSRITGFAGSGEVRSGRVGDADIIASVEPMHGNMLAIYRSISAQPGMARVQLTDQLADGHALACGNLVGDQSDEIVIGWRGNPRNPTNIGLRLWTAEDAQGEKWREHAIDNTGMACEDVRLADLDGDGKLDIIAAGRGTKNLKLYLNRSAR